MSKLPLGSIKNFSVWPFLQSAELLCQADEFERALLVLNNLPAYQRDNPPLEVTQLKNQILSMLMTAKDYTQNKWDEVIDPVESVKKIDGFERGRVVQCLVQAYNYNEKKEVPHIVDMGSGEYWLPIGLSHKEVHDFTYQPVDLNSRAFAIASNYISKHLVKEEYPKGPIIFLAMEIIEHLQNEIEIYQTYLRYANNAKHIVITTPRYTYGGGSPNWKEKENTGLLGHLRAYTPVEFQRIITDMFSRYKFEFVGSDVMIAVGTIKQ